MVALVVDAVHCELCVVRCECGVCCVLPHKRRFDTDTYAVLARSQIKRHPFFAGYDWDQVERGLVRVALFAGFARACALFSCIARACAACHGCAMGVASLPSCFCSGGAYAPCRCASVPLLFDCSVPPCCPFRPHHRCLVQNLPLAHTNTQATPPFVPAVAGPEDTGNVASEFTAMPAAVSPSPATSTALRDAVGGKTPPSFGGFTYMHESVIDGETYRVSFSEDEFTDRDFSDPDAEDGRRAS